MDALKHDGSRGAPVDVMVYLTVDDLNLSGLIGQQISSSRDSGVVFRFDERLAAGASAMTFKGTRMTPGGSSLVVMKVMGPAFMRAAGANAVLAAHKETLSLGRLNAQTPPTPFVVRLIDTGWMKITMGTERIDVPWLAVEYIHGGPMGTTLGQRVANSVTETSQAFEPSRAARAIDCLARGIGAVHDVGVVHRDLKPDNVLCCGTGADELFKVADFGVARAEGTISTFGGGIIGTVGYAAPEQLMPDRAKVGPWTDVFSFGALAFYLLTGEAMFPSRALGDYLLQIESTKRRSILETRSLCSEVREREIACLTIDAVLHQATARDAAARHPSSSAFAAALLPLLSGESWRRHTFIPASSRVSTASPPSWSWTVRHEPERDAVVRSVAWDGDGTCLFATTEGLLFWDGTRVRPAPANGLSAPGSVRFLRRIGPARWLVACADGLFAIYTSDGVCETTRFGDDSISIVDFVGELRDLGVALGVSARGPALLTLCGGRWFNPVALDDVAAVTAFARVDDAEWVVAGRAKRGGAYAGRYFPLGLSIQAVTAPPVRALLAAGGDPGRRIGLLGGTDGAMLWLEANSVTAEALPVPFDVSAVAMDGAGGGWAAGAGHIAYRRPDGSGQRWASVWDDASARTPFVSIRADAGHVVAMTAQGQILEGVGGEAR